MNKKFEIIDHTADIGIKVKGRTIKEIFENSALGMFSLLTDIDRIKPEKKFKVSVKGIDTESLLVNWLNELLYLFTTKKVLLSKFNIKELILGPVGKFNLTSYVYGQKIDFKKNPVSTEIKSATYHNLKIEKSATGEYTTIIIFDV